MFGYTSGELVGQPITHLIPHSASDVMNSFDQAWAGIPVTGIMERGVMQVGRHKNGGVLMVRPTIVHFGDEPEAPLLWSIIDLTAEGWQPSASTDSPHHWESMIDTIDGVVWEADPHTFQFLYVSRKAEALLGYPASYWTQLPTFWIDHVHPLDRDRVVEFYRQHTQAGRSHTMEYRMLAADGRTVWVKDLVVLDRLPSSATRLRGFLVDITEIKQALNAVAVQYEIAMLGAGRSRLEDIAGPILQSMCQHWDWDLGCLWLVDAKAGCLRWETASGLCEDRVRLVTDVQAAWTLRKGEGLAGAAWATKQVEWRTDLAHLPDYAGWSGDERIALCSGVAFPILVQQEPIAIIELFSVARREADDALDTALRGIGIQLGLGLERQQAEERLRTSELRFRQAMETTTDGLWDWNLVTRHAYHSPAWVRMLGLEHHEIPLNNINDWRLRVHPDDRSRFDEILDSLGRPDAPDHFVLEHRLQHRSGRWMWVSMRGRVVERSGDGTPLRVMGITQDLTERIQTEETLRRSAAELEAANAELLKARDEALSAARAKAQFLAMMSHEIRTPMNGVIGMTSVLLETELTEEQRRLVETTKSSGEVALAIINDILDYSKIEAGKLELERIEFDLRLCLEEVTDLFSKQAYGKGLDLALVIEAGVPERVLGDPTRLRQVLLNLIGNAVKFTECGEVVVRVTQETPGGHTPDAVTLRFVVQDTGVGIGRDDQRRLFQVFSQVDVSTTRKYGGTGLGLAIAKRLVELMGGTIDVQSEPGRGSRFWFDVPLFLAPTRTAEPPDRAVTLAGRHVLCVDHHRASRAALVGLLARSEMVPIEASCASEATAILRRAAEAGTPIPLVLMDLHLPDANGYELARVIKTDPALETTKLIALTAVGRQGEAREAREAGFAAYLHKPIRQAALMDCLRLVLGQENRDEASSAPIITRHTLKEAARRHKILLAEDNQVNQLVAVTMLQKLGYAVEVVSDGAQAVEAAQRGGYACVLMDCMMPNLDGYAATGFIRKAETGRPRVPIIALTANALPEDRQRCLDAGMDDFLTKPLRINQLAAVLDRWIPRETTRMPAETWSPESAGRSGGESHMKEGTE